MESLPVKLIDYIEILTIFEISTIAFLSLMKVKTRIRTCGLLASQIDKLHLSCIFPFHDSDMYVIYVEYFKKPRARYNNRKFQNVTFVIVSILCILIYGVNLWVSEQLTYKRILIFNLAVVYKL